MVRNSLEPSSSSSTPPPYAPAVCRVSVAQICLIAGYQGAEAAALRALTDISARYMQRLTGAAASAANSGGRSQSNLFDLVAALEHLAGGRGFAAASDFRRSLLWSSVLRDLRAFVTAIDEIPFPRSLHRRRENQPVALRSPSFAQASRDPPLPHVPRWLPCFPDGWESGARRSDVNEGLKGARGSSVAVREPASPPAERSPELQELGKKRKPARRSNFVMRELALAERSPEVPAVREGLTSACQAGMVRFRVGFPGGKGQEERRKKKIRNFFH